MSINHVKTAVLLAALTGILLLIGYLIGGTSGITIAFIIALIINVVSYWFSDKIVLFMYRAKPATEEKYQKVHDILRELSTRTGLPKPKAYIIHSNHANAFATGRNPKNSAVAVTEGIIDLLNEEELKGVLAHEMAHVKNRDILISTVAATIAGAISYIAFMARFGAIFGGNKERGNIMQLLALSIIAPIAAFIVRMSISRSREYLADETGARMVKNANGLASALAKLHSSAKSTPIDRGTEATSHMFIVNPFSGGAIMNLLNTHPSANSRIGKLRAMKF